MGIFFVKRDTQPKIQPCFLQLMLIIIFNKVLGFSLSFVRNIYFLREARWILIAELDVATSRACPIQVQGKFSQLFS